jgi:PadR family transcriptional regulator PadR
MPFVPIEGLATQLRKGVIEYCVLAMLKEKSRYGGELVQMMSSNDGLLVSEGTIYPLLSRMRADGLVETEWRETSGGSPRRYYSLTRRGQQAVTDFYGEWLRFRATVDGIFGNPGGRRR